MSAALSDGLLPATCPEEQVARFPGNEGVTHENIIGALGRVEGLIEAEATARQEFRASFVTRLESIEKRTGEVALELQRMQMRMEHPAQIGAVQSIAELLKSQPLLSVVFAVIVLALGSGGMIAIVDAVAGK